MEKMHRDVNDAIYKQCIAIKNEFQI